MNKFCQQGLLPHPIFRIWPHCYQLPNWESVMYQHQHSLVRREFRDWCTEFGAIHFMPDTPQNSLCNHFTTADMFNIMFVFSSWGLYHDFQWVPDGDYMDFSVDLQEVNHRLVLYRPSECYSINSRIFSGSSHICQTESREWSWMGRLLSGLMLNLEFQKGLFWPLCCFLSSSVICCW